MTDNSLLDEATTSLDRIQAFDAKSLSRKTELGVARSFDEAVPAAQQIVALFQRIVAEQLGIFSHGQLTQIRDQANSAFNLFQSIIGFDGENAPPEQRRSLIDQAKGLAFNLPDYLAPLISYSVASTLDPTLMQQQMRASAQEFADERAKALSEIEELRQEAEAVLTRVRDAAAEQGISTQSAYFKGLADKHDLDAGNWLGYTLWMGGCTLVFAVIATFSYRIPWVAPRNNIEAVQLITSKVVILGILGYGLVVCVRNFLSQTHNAVVNRHRQNALLTYTAFVDAAPSTASREIVLTHAAASVFSPQDTGYVKGEEPVGGRSVLEMITKASMGDHKP